MPKKINLREAIVRLAPTAPPCFPARDIWIEWLVSAAEFQRGDRHPGPLNLAQGTEPTFNDRVNFCEDCEKARSHDMQRKGLCKPDFLTRKD